MLPEDQLLLGLDPSIHDDSDAWPEFSLTEVTVESSRGKELVSLIEANYNCPVNITGILGIPTRANSKYCISSQNPPLCCQTYRLKVRAPYHQKHAIRVADVVMYSFSQFEDGTFGFWGAGRAGWYRIRSSMSYYAMFAGMEEAVAMFYFLADKCSGMLGSQVKTSRHANETRALKLFDEVGAKTLRHSKVLILMISF